MLRRTALSLLALAALWIGASPLLGVAAGADASSQQTEGETAALNVAQNITAPTSATEAALATAPASETAPASATAPASETAPAPATDAALYPAVSGPVWVLSINGEIELGLASYVRRSLRAASRDEAGAIVLDINTPGGRVDAALDIKDMLLNSEIPTIAIVNRQAFSAGALIALAAERIYMVPGSSIGAAAPVQGNEMAGEKMVSALRAAFASTAETRGRDPLLAKAMVDQEISIAGLAETGKLLTLSHDEALTRGLADGTVASLHALLDVMSRTPTATIVNAEPTFAEKLVRFLTNPAVAALLMSLGFLGVFFELKSPGWGVGGTIAVVCLGLYFWGHHLAGLAGWESAILIGAGVALMAIEVFLVPGFGVFGILGLVSFVAGLFMSRMSQWMLPGEIVHAFYVVSAALLLMLAGAWAMLAYLPSNRFFSGLVLFSAVNGAPPPSDEDVGPPWGKGATSSFRGRTGVAVTDLRPSGTVKIDDNPVDVVTEGQYVQAGTTVEVIEDNGSRRVVREVKAPENQVSS